MGIIFAKKYIAMPMYSKAAEQRIHAAISRAMAGRSVMQIARDTGLEHSYVSRVRTDRRGIKAAAKVLAVMVELGIDPIEAFVGRRCQIGTPSTLPAPRIRLTPEESAV